MAACDVALQGACHSSRERGEAITGDLQKQINSGYRATHLMTVVGKQFASAFYGKAPGDSLFTGCSTGGGQTLHEAEQFPDD